jgi:hypothetical protein
MFDVRLQEILPDSAPITNKVYDKNVNVNHKPHDCHLFEFTETNPLEGRWKMLLLFVCLYLCKHNDCEL